MKKLLLTTAMLLMAPILFAQFSLGLKGGINLNKIHTKAGNLSDNYKESLDTKTGFSAGVFARIGENFFLQPEILYTERKGEVLDIMNNQVEIKTKNIDIPVLVGFKLLKFLRVNAGPVTTLKLKEEINFGNSVSSTLKDEDAFKNATFGYQLGAGVSFGAFDIDVRKEGSLGSISDDYFQDQKFNQRMDGWTVSLGLKIL